MYLNVRGREIVSGASTITQQLVKNVLIPEDERYQQTPQRKIREALLAYQLTQKVSKSQILALYLNEIFYGNQAYGIEAPLVVGLARQWHLRDPCELPLDLLDELSDLAGCRPGLFGLRAQQQDFQLLVGEPSMQKPGKNDR